jgi:hypothetical protein
LRDKYVSVVILSDLVYSIIGKEFIVEVVRNTVNSFRVDAVGTV